MGKRYLHTLLILIGALSYYWYKYLYAYVIYGVEQYNAIPHSNRQWLITTSVVITCVLITLIVSSLNVHKAIVNLGLNKGIIPALIAAVICAIPMFAGGAIYSQPHPDFGLTAATNKAIWPGFVEELVFRGFITGLLVRVANWKLLPAILLSAVIFAWGHIYQAEGFSQKALVFMVTSGAGIGFAIFYKMWGWNLWFPMFLHILMNLSFAIYDMGDNVLLTGTANIFRGITIGLAIIASIYINYRNKRSHSLEQRNA